MYCLSRFFEVQASRNLLRQSDCVKKKTKYTFTINEKHPDVKSCLCHDGLIRHGSEPILHMVFYDGKWRGAHIQYELMKGFLVKSVIQRIFGGLTEILDLQRADTIVQIVARREQDRLIDLGECFVIKDKILR